MLQGVFVEIFSKLKDPRVERTKKHLFLDVIGLAWPYFQASQGRRVLQKWKIFANCTVHF